MSLELSDAMTSSTEIHLVPNVSRQGRDRLVGNAASMKLNFYCKQSLSHGITFLPKQKAAVNTPAAFVLKQIPMTGSDSF